MKHLSAREARDLGLVLEINRKILHPRGLALEITYDVDGENDEQAQLRVQDHRRDPEGVYFDELDQLDVRKARKFDRLLEERAPSRRAQLGYNDLWVEIAEDTQGSPCIVSTWELNDDERKAIAEGGTLELCVWGRGHLRRAAARADRKEDRSVSPLPSIPTVPDRNVPKPKPNPRPRPK